MVYIAKPSDALSHLRDLITEFNSANPQLAALLDMPLQALFVLDTERIIRDLRYLAKPNQEPEARTNLQTAIASGTIIACVPHHVRKEVEKYIPGLAQELDIKEYRLWAIWQSYQKYLSFSDIDEVDPQPYYKAACFTGNKPDISS